MVIFYNRPIYKISLNYLKYALVFNKKYKKMRLSLYENLIIIKTKKTNPLHIYFLPLSIRRKA